MNSRRLIVTMTITTMLICSIGGAAGSDGHFLRAVSTLNLNDAQVHTQITAAQTTNALPAVSVTWRAGDVIESNSKPMTQAGWFAFAESPTCIWVFDGGQLSLLERTDKSVSDS